MAFFHKTPKKDLLKNLKRLLKGLFKGLFYKNPKTLKKGPYFHKKALFSKPVNQMCVEELRYSKSKFLALKIVYNIAYNMAQKILTTPKV